MLYVSFFKRHYNTIFRDILHTQSHSSSFNTITWARLPQFSPPFLTQTPLCCSSVMLDGLTWPSGPAIWMPFLIILFLQFHNANFIFQPVSKQLGFQPSSVTLIKEGRTMGQGEEDWGHHAWYFSRKMWLAMWGFVKISAYQFPANAQDTTESFFGK